MNEADIRLFGKLVSELRDLDQRRTEIFSEFLNEIGKPILEAKKAEKPTEQEFNGLGWTLKKGIRGDYEQTENNGSPEFKALAEYLKAHNGFVNLHGWKVFFHYKDENVIDLKK